MLDVGRVVTISGKPGKFGEFKDGGQGESEVAISWDF